ncbi:hypothetical protein PVAP13_9NG700600 [Panicum virgatum]|uniref:Uncharacterized protein n=1 Tax=Panicum virgatum TaxID=38727 RepID=A0A8T0N3V8_PANVG|nr:hypothetical protein PVAP13_9NG700600 [Panicum virgatum]
MVPGQRRHAHINDQGLLVPSSWGAPAVARCAAGPTHGGAINRELDSMPCPLVGAHARGGHEAARGARHGRTRSLVHPHRRAGPAGPCAAKLNSARGTLRHACPAHLHRLIRCV